MKYLIVLMALLTSLTINAQTRLLPVECGNLKDLTAVMVEFNEKPFAAGETVRSTNNRTIVESVVIFFLNKRTKTWTVVEKISDDLYCVVSSGKNFNIVEDTPT